MNKFITALLLFTASSFGAGIPYLTEPTNSRVDTYIPQATGPNQKWVPYLNVTNAVTNMILRPGTGGITISTNVNGVDYTVNSTNWVYDARNGGLTNSRGPVEITNSLRLLGGSLMWTNGDLGTTHYWEESQGADQFLSLYYDGTVKFFFDSVAGSFTANNHFGTPTNTAAVGNIPVATSIFGATKWQAPPPFVSSGTNITLVTNGSVVTVSVSNTNLPVVAAGTNVTVLTNGLVYTVSSSSTNSQAPFVAAGTNITAVTNSGVVTISVSNTNLPVVIAGTNVTVQTNGLAYTVNSTSSGSGGSGVGPGTLNHLSMFNSTTTNVIDSNLTQTDTNQWQYRTAAPGTTFTNGMTNIWWEKYIAAGTNRGLKLIENGNLCELKQFSTEVIAPGGDVFAGMKFNDAWLINGSGVVANGGHNGDLLPMADSDGTTGITIGNSVNKVKSIALSTGSAGGVLMPDNGYVQSAGVYAVWGGSGWLLHYKTSNYDFFGAFATGSPNGPCVSVASGTYAGNSLANGSGSVSSAVADCFFGPGRLAHSWALNTNNNTTGSQSISRLTGTENTGATDGLGGDLILGGGSGTSLGRSGNLRLQTSPPLAATGNSAQTYQDRFVMTGVPVTLTTNSATTICTFTVPTSLTCVGGEFSATVQIKDATDIATVHERFAFNAINKAGTVTATNQSVPTITSPLATGSAGVTTVWTISVSGTTCSIKCNATTTGILATTARVLGPRIELDSDGVSVVTFQQ